MQVAAQICSKLSFSDNGRACMLIPVIVASALWIYRRNFNPAGGGCEKKKKDGQIGLVEKIFFFSHTQATDSYFVGYG